MKFNEVWYQWTAVDCSANLLSEVRVCSLNGGYFTWSTNRTPDGLCSPEQLLLLLLRGDALCGAPAGQYDGVVVLQGLVNIARKTCLASGLH
jgi:hypothetical protein